MQNTCIVILSMLAILSFHESGHYIAARLMHCNVEKVTFRWTPIPRIFVTIIDSGLSGIQKIIYWIAGNLMTLFLFAVYNIFGISFRPVTSLFVLQIIIETNPFYSDYSNIAFYIKNRRKLRSMPAFIQDSQMELRVNQIINELKENYFLSDVWYIHFITWGILIVVACKLFNI